MTSHSQIFMEPLGVALQRAALCLLVLPNRPPPEKFAEFVLENFPGHFELCRQVGIVQPFDVEGGSSSTRPHGSGPSGTRPSGSHVANDIITPSPSPSGSHVAEMKSEVKEEVKEEEVAAQGSNSEGGDGCSCMSGTCFSLAASRASQAAPMVPRSGGASHSTRRTQEWSALVPHSVEWGCARDASVATPSAVIAPLRGRGSARPRLAPASLGCSRPQAIQHVM